MAGNWKMYKTPAETSAFFEKFRPLAGNAEHCEVVICPPFTNLPAAVKAADGQLFAGLDAKPADVECAVAEAGDFAFRVDHWMLRKCADHAGSAEADRDHACANVASADCPHYVVSAAGADEGIFGQHNEKIFSTARI
jgi:hypothetical protein